MVTKGRGAGKGRIGSLGLAAANQYMGWTNNKVLLYNTYIMEKKKNTHTHTRITESVCYTAEITTL